MLVRRLEDTAEPLNMVRLPNIHTGITKVQLDSFEAAVFGAAAELVQGIVFERVKTEKSGQPVGVARGLLGDPVVFCTNLVILVLYGGIA